MDLLIFCVEGQQGWELRSVVKKGKLGMKDAATPAGSKLEEKLERAQPGRQDRTTGVFRKERRSGRKRKRKRRERGQEGGQELYKQ